MPSAPLARESEPIMNPTIVTLDNQCSVRGFIDRCGLSDRSPATSGQSNKGTHAPVLKFLGIPYATPERWTRPTEDSKWEGTRDCFEFGPIPYQPAGMIPLEQVWFDAPGFHPRRHLKQDEQCLSANVFRPTNIADPSARLPVFVFLYGGALRIGCSTKTRHDPTELIRLSEEQGQPIVVVTFNYRVGLLGFLNHPDLADEKGNFGNFGLHDQLYFLKWLQRNIGLFGGDKDNITVMGNSAGAWTIGALMTRREKEWSMLFKNIIFSSGGPGTMSFRPRGSYYPYYDQLLAKAGVSSSTPQQERVAAIKAIPAEDILEFSNQYFPYGNFGATVEEGPGAIFDKPSFEYLHEGDFDPNIASCIVGCVTNESTLSGHTLKMATIKGHSDYIQRFPPSVQSALLGLYPLPSIDSPDITIVPGYQLLADHIFTGVSYHLAHVLSTTSNKYTGRKLPVYNFRFNTVLISSRPDLGIFHTSDLAFVFQTNTMWSKDSPQDLTARGWGKRWIEFFYTGAPGTDWPAFNADTQSRLIIGPSGEFRVESVKDAYNIKQLEWWNETLRKGGHEAIRIRAQPGDVLKAGLGETMDKMT